MRYLKKYISIHLKYWWLYLISIGTLFYGTIFLLLSVSFLAMYGMNEVMAWIISILIGNVVCSFPLIYVNRKIALEHISQHNKNTNVALLTIYNHMITYIVYLAILMGILYLG